MKMENTKESEAFEILRNACIKRMPLELRVFGRKKQDEYRSRFLQLDEYDELPTVTVEAPSVENENILVPLDREVEVSFLHKKQPHFFITLVSKHGEFRLSRKKIVRSLELLAPTEIVLAEKRSFYRVHLGEDRPIEIKLEILAEEETGRVRSKEKGLITTIGGNGLGFYLPDGKSLLLNVDTPLRLKFRLQPEEEELKLLANIRFRLRRPKMREIFFGVQFTDVDSDIKYKKSVDRILRFVAEEQRRHLSQRIHLNK